MSEALKTKQYAFLHIPKTAGTSFIHAIRQIFPQTSPSFGASHLKESDALDLDHFDVVAGHLSYQDCNRYFPARHTFTILREPVQRCISWYWYAREVVPDSVESEEVQSAKKMHIDDFFSLDAATIKRNNVNRQTRQLGGHALQLESDDAVMLNLAKNNLENMFWVGDISTMQSEVSRLRTAPGFEQLPDLPFLNEGGRHHKGISSKLKSRIEQLNWADMELYEDYLANKRIRSGRID